MSDDSLKTPPADASTGTESAASEAWNEVVSELNALGEAVRRWVSAAASDEENKRRAAELKAAFERIAGDVSATIKDAADSEVGHSFKDAADKTGEAFKKAGEKISEEAGPKVASAFRSLSDKFRETAQKMEERVAAERGDSAPSPDDTDA